MESLNLCLLVILSAVLTAEAAVNRRTENAVNREVATPGAANKTSDVAPVSKDPPAPPPNSSTLDLGGATYVRWGRTTCADTDTELVYSGVAGGGYAGHDGGGGNLLCLTRKPEYKNATVGQEKHALLYGAEYLNPNNYFSNKNAPENKVNGLNRQDVPCAVCRANTRRTTIMIPGRMTCHGEGWTMEYWGYLVTNYWGNKAQLDYLCVDHAPEADAKGNTAQSSAYLYVVQGVCGSLPCPPYMNNWELTCVVCTK